MGNDRVIGYQNKLPWHLPADLKWFKQCTLGKPIIMGRPTYESIGKPLPGRLNIVLTNDFSYQVAGCEVVHSVDAALDAAGETSEVMIIGGARIYECFMPFIEKMYLTLIDHPFPGDAYFPKWDAKEWETVERISHQPDDKNPYAYEFLILLKKTTINTGK